MKKSLFLSMLVLGSLSASAQSKVMSGTPCETAEAMTLIVRLQLSAGSNFLMPEFFPEAARPKGESGQVQWTFQNEYASEAAAKKAQTALAQKLSVCLGAVTKEAAPVNSHLWKFWKEGSEIEVEARTAGKMLMLTFRKIHVKIDVEKHDKDMRELLDYTPPKKS